MFLIRWLRELLSLPFLWAGRLASMLKLALDAPLLQAAWHISHNGRTGAMALVVVYRRQGLQAAAAKAQLWMRSCPRPETAAFAGVLAIETGNLDLARSYLDQGRQLGDDKAGMLDGLEYHVAAHGDPVSLTQLAQRLSVRNDLPANLSRMVLSELLWEDMFGRRWEDAAAKAGRLLAVADAPEVEAALWAMAVQRGDTRSSENHLARVNLPPLRRAGYLCMGNAAIGAMEQAKRHLEEVRQIDPAAAQRIEDSLRAREVTL